MESETRDREPNIYERIPTLVKLMLELSLSCIILLGGPLLLYHYFAKHSHAPFYSPYDTPPPSGNKAQLAPEVERWSTLLFVLVAGAISSHRLAQLSAWLAGRLFRKHRHGLKKETMRFLELTMTSSLYFYYWLSSVVFWTAARALFPVPVDPRLVRYYQELAAGKKDAKMPKVQFLERPRFFHLERFAFVAVFFFLCLMIEQAVLHSLSLYFGQTVYKERVAQCNYKLWVIKTMISACKRHKQPVDYHHVGQQPTGGLQATFGERQDNVAAFILEHNAVVSGQPREGLADLLFDHFSRRPDTPASNDFVVLSDATTSQDTNSQDTLTIDQLSTVFAEDELKRAFHVFDPTDSGVTSREEVRRAVQEAWAERWAILNGVTGHSKMVSQLDALMRRLLIMLTMLFVFFAYGIRMDNLTKILTFLMIPASRALRTFFSAIFYIFTTHPFDVGDRVTVQGTHFFVQHVGLLFTQFRRMDGAVVYYPNYLLANLAVNNIKRSPRQSAKFDMCFDAPSATPQKIGILRQRLQEALSKSTRDFVGGQCWFLQMPDASRIQLTLVLNHAHNQQEGHPYAMRNTGFLDLVRDITRDLGLEYKPPVRSILAEEEVSLICVE